MSKEKVSSPAEGSAPKVDSGTKRDSKTPTAEGSAPKVESGTKRDSKTPKAEGSAVKVASGTKRDSKTPKAEGSATKVTSGTKRDSKSSAKVTSRKKPDAVAFSTPGTASNYIPIGDDPDGTIPDFIYGGPFIPLKKPSPFLDTATPINMPLQGTFKKSFAYHSLKEKMPAILTKVIENLSSKSDEDSRIVVAQVNKLKSDLIENSKYDKLQAGSEEAEKWNEWIEGLDQPKYFTNSWLWTESYIYRMIRDACERTKGMQNFDVFGQMKANLVTNSMEPMCLVAEKVVTMLGQSAKDQKKNDFMTLLKICMWATKMDLTLTAGEPVTFGYVKPPEPVKAAKGGKGKGAKGAPPPPPPPVVPVEPKILTDPVQMVLDLKERLLVDDSGKAYENLNTKAENMRKAIAGNTTFKQKCSCHRLAKLFGMQPCPNEPPEAPPEGGEPPKPVPCPAKITIPSVVQYDIVCGNAGYELFTDMCFATFLISQKIVERVRFHLKKYPWYVSAATVSDFNKIIDSCKNASFSKTIEAEPKPAPPEGEPAPPEEPPKTITSDALRQLGDTFAKYAEDGIFFTCEDPYWTYPHVYKDMKKYEYHMYRKMQLSAGALYKGDLNYRRLVGERNCNPNVGFDPSLQGYNPAPTIAARTIQSDTVCGLPKGRWEALNSVDGKWMEKGEYGVIQLSPKGEALKVADRPCVDYGEACHSVKCPLHPEL